ncbi:MAG TPA: hypothetical protein GXZ80_02675 [Euryarchaeota archaeon]|jgi:hypothetical protein|nr:hypothetical protein [Euryarchaeota archaeon]
MYTVKPIGPGETKELFESLSDRFLYTVKSEIHGACVRLLTDQERTKDVWENNFYNMSENVRSHCRLIVLDLPGEGLTVRYDPLTRTAFLFNFEYYGWIKSVALAVVSDLLEDQHRIYSVHGAALDVAGTGVSLIAPSKTGKTTHSWGLLRGRDARLITDDWYFVHLSERSPLAYGSEKNFYIDEDIGGIWPEYRSLVDKAEFDNKGRAIVNVRWAVGQGGVVPMTSIRKVILLKRDRGDDALSRELGTEEALQYLLDNDFCNPHQLVRDDRKLRLRTEFFRRYLDGCEVHMVNTVAPSEEVHEEVQRIARSC